MLVQNYEELAPRGLAVDRTLLTSTWLMLAILCCVLGWELLKWSVLATSRRARRLARLRDQTASVVQRELDRQWDVREASVSEPLGEPQGRLQPTAKAKTRGVPGRRSQRIAEIPQCHPVDQTLEVDVTARGSHEVLREETVVRGLFTRRR